MLDSCGLGERKSFVPSYITEPIFPLSRAQAGHIRVRSGQSGGNLKLIVLTWHWHPFGSRRLPASRLVLTLASPAHLVTGTSSPSSILHEPRPECDTGTLLKVRRRHSCPFIKHQMLTRAPFSQRVRAGFVQRRTAKASNGQLYGGAR